MQSRDPTLRLWLQKGRVPWSQSPGARSSVLEPHHKTTDTVTQAQCSNSVNSPVNCKAPEETLIKVVSGSFSFSDEIISGYQSHMHTIYNIFTSSEMLASVLKFNVRSLCFAFTDKHPGNTEILF